MVKVCPKCGSATFMAIIKRAGIIEIEGTDENNNLVIDILKENTNNYEVEIVACAECKERLTEDDLVAKIVKCNRCGREVSQDEVDQDGNCSVCALLETNPELANASQEDLLRLLVKAYRNLNDKTSIVEQKQKEAAQANTSNSAEEPAKKPRRRAVKKKVQEEETQAPQQQQEEDPQNVSQTPVEPAQSVSDTSVEDNPPVVTQADIVTQDDEGALVNAQSAPFPDVENPFEETQANSQDNDVGFKMFEQEEDPF